MLRRIPELEEKSTKAVRIRDSDFKPMPLRWRIRQGSQLSPMIVNMFTNDILKGAELTDVPIGKCVTLPGLFFAEDLVWVASTGRKAEPTNSQLTQWLVHNEMALGIHDFRIMAVNDASEKLSSLPQRWQLEGEQIAICEEYTYVGVRSSMELKVPLVLTTFLAN